MAFEKEVKSVLFFYVIALVCALISVYVQFRIFYETEKKRNMLYIPITFAIPTIFILVRYTDDSFFSFTSWLYIFTLFIGVPIVIGSLIGGLICIFRK